jgi:dTDP-4-dehydrorhamnose 3,5-epimerase
MSNFSLLDTPLKGLYVVKRNPTVDQRGYLERIYCVNALNNLFQDKGIRQINHTLTRNKGTVRGLHFQYPPFAETKFISCTRGVVWDVAVDLRDGSPTYLQHYALELSEDNFLSLLIPEGFAHGFQTLTSDCEMLYLHTADYNINSEGAINAIDPVLNITWPQTITERSFRDLNHPMIPDNFSGIKL